MSAVANSLTSTSSHSSSPSNGGLSFPFSMKYILSLLFALAVFSAGAQSMFVAQAESNSGDSFFIVANDAGNATMTITTPTEYELLWDDLTIAVLNDGATVELTDRKGNKVITLNYFYGQVWTTSYGTEELIFKVTLM